MLSDFIDFARVRIERTQQLDLREIVNHALQVIRQHPSYHGEIEIEVLLEDRPVLFDGDEDLMHRWIEKGPDQDSDSMLVTRAVKAYYDGALGSRGARLLYDYSDKEGHRGVSGDDYGFNEELNARAMKKGFQVGIHAIGDAGNREVLNILESV